MNIIIQYFGFPGFLVAWAALVAISLVLITSVRSGLRRRAHRQAAQAAISQVQKKLNRAKAFARERYGMTEAIGEADEYFGRAQALLGLNNHLVFQNCAKANRILTLALRTSKH